MSFPFVSRSLKQSNSGTSSLPSRISHRGLLTTVYIQPHLSRVDSTFIHTSSLPPPWGLVMQASGLVGHPNSRLLALLESPKPLQSEQLLMIPLLPLRMQPPSLPFLSRRHSSPIVIHPNSYFHQAIISAARIPAYARNWLRQCRYLSPPPLVILPRLSVNVSLCLGGGVS